MKKINSILFNEFLDEELEGDKEFLCHLGEIFIKYLDELVEFPIEDSQESKESISKLTHRIRSSAISFGAVSLSTRLEDLELNVMQMPYLKLESEFQRTRDLATEVKVELTEIIERMNHRRMKIG